MRGWLVSTLCALLFATLAPSTVVAQSAAGELLEAGSQALTADSPPGNLGSQALPVRSDSQPEAGGRFSKAIEIALLLTALSLLPAILITITSFTRIVIVLSFVRRALSINELPPNPVIIGLALFLTIFVMAPVGRRIHERSWEPYRDGQLSAEQAGGLAWQELRGFLIANTRENELALFADMAHVHAAPADGSVVAATIDDGALQEDLPLTVVIPAFVLSELKTAFQMGFLLFLPFLVIDLIVSSILLSMGMFMLPPVMISTPFKILVFVLVDGWRLICESVVTSFITT